VNLLLSPNEITCGKKENNEKSIKSALHTRPQAKTEFAGEKVVLRLHSTRSKLDDSIIRE
jgi:hypothetical protein